MAKKPKRSDPATLAHQSEQRLHTPSGMHGTGMLRRGILIDHLNPQVKGPALQTLMRISPW